MENQLRRILFDAVMEKVSRDQALTLKELAVWTGFSYSSVRAWGDLPIINRRIFPQDFILWRRRKSGLGFENGSEGRLPRLRADKSGESLLTHD